MIDVCVNLLNSQFRGDRTTMLQRARDAGVHGILITATDLNTTRLAVEVCQSRQANGDDASQPQLFCTAGVHPHDAGELPDNWLPELQAMASSQQVRAIGETGLDFYRNFSPRDRQVEVFGEQIRLAVALQKPLFVHDRESGGEVLHQLQTQFAEEASSRHPPVLIHCFTGTERELHDYLQAGFYIGITGWVTDHKRGQALRQLVQHIPLQRLLIETDAPFLRPHNTPQSFLLENKLPNKFKRRNEPALLALILEEVAAIRGEDVRRVATATTQNAATLFGFDNSAGTEERL